MTYAYKRKSELNKCTVTVTCNAPKAHLFTVGGIRPRLAAVARRGGGGPTPRRDARDAESPGRRHGDPEPGRGHRGRHTLRPGRGGRAQEQRHTAVSLEECYLHQRHCGGPGTAKGGVASRGCSRQGEGCRQNRVLSRRQRYKHNTKY
ncbi:hypothetical protein FOCC_FOCC004916 [Frankliniella occidentalis]|nr:hypothetical protein FOCC_FOCC004916 [Frankliniella occidentalis]